MHDASRPMGEHTKLHIFDLLINYSIISKTFDQFPVDAVKSDTSEPQIVKAVEALTPSASPIP
jgi:hypothetical protein